MTLSVTLDAAGRLVLPAGVRKSLGIAPGSRLILSVEGQVVKLTPVREAVRKAQAILAPYRLKDGRSAVDEFLADRAAEAAHEYE